MTSQISKYSAWLHMVNMQKKLTQLPLVTYDDKEGDARAKAVCREEHGAGPLGVTPTHRPHHVLVRCRTLHV